MPDPTLPGLAHAHSAIAFNKRLNDLQLQILNYIFRKRTASSTAILNFINLPARYTAQPTRSQSAISHSLSDLVTWGYLHRLPGGDYATTRKAHHLLRDTIRLASLLEADYRAIFPTTMQTAHVESPRATC